MTAMRHALDFFESPGKAQRTSKVGEPEVPFRPKVGSPSLLEIYGAPPKRLMRWRSLFGILRGDKQSR
jgi:hypothetical protein